jgi:hypothetical protein
MAGSAKYRKNQRLERFMASALSAEGQHLIDSLESHLLAVKAAVVNSEPQLVALAKTAWDDVLAALKPVEAKLRAAGAAQAPVAAGTGSSVKGNPFAGKVG